MLKHHKPSPHSYNWSPSHNYHYNIMSIQLSRLHTYSLKLSLHPHYLHSPLRICNKNYNSYIDILIYHLYIDLPLELSRYSYYFVFVKYSHYNYLPNLLPRLHMYYQVLLHGYYTSLHSHNDTSDLPHLLPCNNSLPPSHSLHTSLLARLLNSHHNLHSLLRLRPHNQDIHSLNCLPSYLYSSSSLAPY